MKRVVGVLATAALMATVWPATAQAAGPRVCTGTIRNVKVAGDLVVPADRSCTLSGVTVTGTVSVGERARLTTTRSTLGALKATLAANYDNQNRAEIWMTGGRVRGATTLTNLVDLHATGTRFNSIQGRGMGERLPNLTVDLQSSVVTGTISATNSARLLLVRSRANTVVAESGTSGQIALWNSRVSGNATLTGNLTSVCGTRFSRALTVHAGVLRFGSNQARCGGNRVAGVATITGAGWFAGNRFSSRVTIHNPYDGERLLGSRNTYRRGATITPLPIKSAFIKAWPAPQREW